MARRERLYERPLRRPMDAEALEELRSTYHRRRHEIPVESELIEHPGFPERMTIRTHWLSFVIQFHEEKLTVDAELSLAARLMATEPNRRRAVEFIDRLVDELNL